ncbi:MAG: flagellar motor switch protein FliN [Planctomycetota bacterium]|nr:flagellar motor switch protein FliN [Planctomycetota bacterium]
MAARQTALAPMNIMVVDDDPALRSLFSQYLSDAGHKIAEADNGAAALESIARAPVDLVLTDLRMDGVSGIDVLKGVQEKHPETGVMLITGFATLDSAMEAMRLGAIDVIQKPVNLEELGKKIDAYISKKKLGKAGKSGEAQPTPVAAVPAPAGVEVRPIELPHMQPGSPDGPADSIDRILDIPVTATVMIGKASMQISDLLKLGPGTVIELQKAVGEPMELLINEKLIAYGEVVVVNDTFGLRVTGIVDPKQRIQSLR